MSSRPGSTAVTARRKGKENEVLDERAVIDEKLITMAVKDELDSTHEPGMAPDIKEVDLATIDTLVLSFKNIYAIDNLQGFNNLTRLQLDNNIIDRIDHLDHLVHLKWLDLSFNNISKIENLDKLVNLEDLSLFDNHITRIEGLENLKNLNVLSLGNNKLTDLNQVKDLRSYKNLRLLNLKGNPLSNLEDYQNTIFAFLTQLKYLDYEMIEPASFQKARDSMLELLVDLEEKEKLDAENEKLEEVRRQEIKRQEEANLEGLATLFEDILAKDNEQEKLQYLPEMENLLETYKAAFKDVVSDYTEMVLSKHTLKVAEKEQFFGALKSVTEANEKEAVELVQEFEAKKKKAFLAFDESLETGYPKIPVLESLRGHILLLSDELMNLEMHMVEQNEDLLKEFEETFLDFVRQILAKHGTSFTALSDTAGNFFEQLREHVQHMLAEHAEKEDDPDAQKNVNLNALLSDKDTLVNAVTQSHDAHISSIMKMEDAIREREDGSAKKLVNTSRDDEYRRNRHRVAEIYELVERNTGLIDERIKEANERDEGY